MLQLGIIGLALLLATEGTVTKEVKKQFVEPTPYYSTVSQCRHLDPIAAKNLNPLSWTFVGRVNKMTKEYKVCVILITPRIAVADFMSTETVYAKQLSIDIGGQKQTPKNVFRNRLILLSKEVKLPANVILPSYPKNQITYEGCTCIHTRTDSAPVSVRKSRVIVISSSECNSPEEKLKFICTQHLDEVPRGPDTKLATLSQTDQLLCPVAGSPGYVLASVGIAKFGSRKKTGESIVAFRSINYDAHWVRMKIDALSTK